MCPLSALIRVLGRTLGTPIIAPHTRTTVGQLYSVGACVDTGGVDASVAVFDYEPSGQWTDARQSHEYRFGTSLSVSRSPPKGEGVWAEQRWLSPSLQLFKRMLDQFDRLRKRNAFLEQYKKEKMFENSLEEFDDAR